MADTLQLRVTEQKYLDTLSKLDGQLNRLKTVKNDLKKARNTLERSYKGNEVRDLIQAAKNYEQRAQEAIDDVNKKRLAISDYLTGQQNVSNRAANEYGAELTKSSQPFA